MLTPQPQALSTVLSMIEQDVWMLSADHKHLWHNKGTSYTDWCRSFLRTRNLDLVNAYLDKCINGKDFNAALDVEKEDGQGCRKWVRLVCRPIEDKGEVVGVVGTEKDVTTVHCVLPRLLRLQEELRGQVNT